MSKNRRWRRDFPRRVARIESTAGDRDAVEVTAEHNAASADEQAVEHARGKFLRVPIMPNGAELYTRQITDTAIRGDVPATLRLSLLPYLASAAAVAFRITGSDKGIW